MIRLCRANSEGILYSPAIQMVGSLYKHKKATYFRRSLSWYHQESKVAPWRELAGIPCSGAPTVRAIKSISPQPILIVSTAVEMAELQGCKATAVCVASEHARMIRLCRANSEGILYPPATKGVSGWYKHKKATYFRRSLSWYHQETLSSV